MKKLLVMGGSGFVGGHVTIKAQGDWEVTSTFLDRPFRLPNVESVQLDITRTKDLRMIMERVRPDAVIHAAAWSGLERCEEDWEGAFSVNTESTWNIAELCKERESRLIFASSDMVFNGEIGPYSEAAAVHPINVYGETKVMAEQMIRSSLRDHVIARIALVYGRSVTGSNSFSEKVTTRLKQGKPMMLYTDQIRTPILVQDLAAALLELAVSDLSGTIHLGGAERVNRYEFGRRIAEIHGFPEQLLEPVTMETMPTKAPRPKDVSLDTTLARSVLKTVLRGYTEGLLEA